RAAQVSLSAEIATDYVTLRATEAKLAVVNATLGTLAENLQFAQWQEQAGSGSALDTQQALSTLEQTRASIPSLELILTQTRNQLAVLCGQAPGSLDALLAGTGRVPAAPVALSIGIPAETLGQRPDVRAAVRTVEAAAARTSAAQRARYPSLSLTGSLGVDALRAGQLFSPASSVASVLGSLSAPIFSADRISQTIQIQSAVEKQALIAYESTVLTALAEVENALVSLQRNAERLASLDKATTAARESSTLAHQRYEAGAVDFLTVLDAQRSLLALQESQVSTAADLTTAHVQLYKALGGGWTNL
ncbi:MAG: efflux transporter outer membrane subunit, partial [Verrucomicrobia bacterium]|nr:efflux transporter outer membrane subunit [Verrucomicrobiota bacterium]